MWFYQPVRLMDPSIQTLLGRSIDIVHCKVLLYDKERSQEASLQQQMLEKLSSSLINGVAIYTRSGAKETSAVIGI